MSDISRIVAVHATAEPLAHQVTLVAGQAALDRDFGNLQMVIVTGTQPGQVDPIGDLVIPPSTVFVAETTKFNGPFEISPFNPEGQLGGGVLVNPDLIKMDGQFMVKNFDPSVAGTQTFSFTEEDGPSDPGVPL